MRCSLCPALTFLRRRCPDHDP
ncbi:hypothetical protein AB0B74_25560 [Micromonospora parva]